MPLITGDAVRGGGFTGAPSNYSPLTGNNCHYGDGSSAGAGYRTGAGSAPHVADNAFGDPAGFPDAPPVPGAAHTAELRRSADGLRVRAMAADAAGAWTPPLAA